MPLRDHFRPPISARHSWEGFYGGWPAMLLQYLFSNLSDRYFAEPRVKLGTYLEIDVAEMEDDAGLQTGDLADQYEYEVLVYDQTRGRLFSANHKHTFFRNSTQTLAIRRRGAYSGA